MGPLGLENRLVRARQHTITTHSQHVVSSICVGSEENVSVPATQRGFTQCSATKDAIMATCLAVAVSSVPADRWPDGSLSLTSHPCLRPCRFVLFPITPPPPLTYQGPFVVLLNQTIRLYIHSAGSKLWEPVDLVVKIIPVM